MGGSYYYMEVFIRFSHQMNVHGQFTSISSLEPKKHMSQLFKYITRNMKYLVTNILWGGNHCANRKTNIGLSLQTLTWWNQVRGDVREHFYRNK